MKLEILDWNPRLETNMETEVGTDTQGADIVSEFQARVQEWGRVDNEDKVRLNIRT